ncbi:ZC3H3 protein, partial [Rhinopomastus cyanomelas]|nr:ZC3H3 protein [Rhinopomastus cyanomelas]
SPSPSKGAVTLKLEPQEPPVLPDFSAVTQHLQQRKVELPTPGCQQVKGGASELKLLGKSQVDSRPSQPAVSAVGVTPARSRFNVTPKATGLPRAASTPISSKAPKFRKTNYTWVANPAKCSRPVKRWVSPRASESTKKVTGGAERAAKPSPRGDLGAKSKKSTLQTKAGVCASKYKWKASSLQASPSTSRSAFRWRCEDQKKPPVLSLSRTGTVPLPPSAAAIGLSGVKPFNASALSSYKVKSRTKIIKRKGNSGSPTEKKSSSSPTAPLKSHFHLRKKMSLRGKTSTPLKRSSPRGLVHITKHRLCRLQVSTKEGANVHFVRSSPANKVIKTRYRIIKKNVVPPALSSFSSPVPSWKMRRPVTSR